MNSLFSSHPFSLITPIPPYFLRRAETFYEMLFIPMNCFACVNWDQQYQLLLKIVGKALIWYVLVLAVQQTGIA